MYRRLYRSRTMPVQVSDSELRTNTATYQSKPERPKSAKPVEEASFPPAPDSNPEPTQPPPSDGRHAGRRSDSFGFMARESSFITQCHSYIAGDADADDDSTPPQPLPGDTEEPQADSHCSDVIEVTSRQTPVTSS